MINSYENILGKSRSSSCQDISSPRVRSVSDYSVSKNIIKTPETAENMTKSPDYLSLEDVRDDSGTADVDEEEVSETGDSYYFDSMILSTLIVSDENEQSKSVEDRQWVTDKISLVIPRICYQGYSEQFYT